MYRVKSYSILSRHAVKTNSFSVKLPYFCQPIACDVSKLLLKKGDQHGMPTSKENHSSTNYLKSFAQHVGL